MMILSENFWQTFSGQQIITITEEKNPMVQSDVFKVLPDELGEEKKRKIKSQN